MSLDVTLPPVWPPGAWLAGIESKTWRPVIHETAVSLQSYLHPAPSLRPPSATAATASLAAIAAAAAAASAAACFIVSAAVTVYLSFEMPRFTGLFVVPSESWEGEHCRVSPVCKNLLVAVVAAYGS